MCTFTVTPRVAHWVRQNRRDRDRSRGPEGVSSEPCRSRVGGRDARRSRVSRFLPPDTATRASSAQGPSQPFIDSAKRCTGESLQSQGSPGSERRPPDSEFTSRTRRPAARGGLIDWAPVGCTLEASDPGPVAGPYYAIDLVTSLFTAQLGRDLPDDEYREVQAHLMDRPDAGARSFPFRTRRETRSVPRRFLRKPGGGAVGHEEPELRPRALQRVRARPRSDERVGVRVVERHRPGLHQRQRPNEAGRIILAREQALAVDAEGALAGRTLRPTCARSRA